MKSKDSKDTTLGSPASNLKRRTCHSCANWLCFAQALATVEFVITRFSQNTCCYSRPAPELGLFRTIDPQRELSPAPRAAPISGHAGTIGFVLHDRLQRRPSLPVRKLALFRTMTRRPPPPGSVRLTLATSNLGLLLQLALFVQWPSDRLLATDY